jgi:hypothetical protein
MSRVGKGIRKSKRSNHASTTELVISGKWNSVIAQNRCLTSIEEVLWNSFDIGVAGK